MHFINPIISIRSFREEGSLLRIENILDIKISFLTPLVPWVQRFRNHKKRLNWTNKVWTEEVGKK